VGLTACKRGLLQTWDLGYEDALRLEGHMFNSTMREDTPERIAAVQALYDAGSESWEAFGLDRPRGEATGPGKMAVGQS
jgi:hypothetical protein